MGKLAEKNGHSGYVTKFLVTISAHTIIMHGLGVASLTRLIIWSDIMMGVGKLPEKMDIVDM